LDDETCGASSPRAASVLTGELDTGGSTYARYSRRCKDQVRKIRPGPLFQRDRLRNDCDWVHLFGPPLERVRSHRVPWRYGAADGQWLYCDVWAACAAIGL